MAGAIFSVADAANGDQFLTIVDARELSVGQTRTQVTTRKGPARIWIGAPTAAHTAAAQNQGTIMAGVGAKADLLAGGVPIEPTDHQGRTFRLRDASTLYVVGTDDADKLIVQIEQ